MFRDRRNSRFSLGLNRDLFFLGGYGWICYIWMYFSAWFGDEKIPEFHLKCRLTCLDSSGFDSFSSDLASIWQILLNCLLGGVQLGSNKEWWFLHLPGKSKGSELAFLRWDISQSTWLWGWLEERKKKKRGDFTHGQDGFTTCGLRMVTCAWRGTCPEGTSEVFCSCYQDEEVDYCILKKTPEPEVSVVILLLDIQHEVWVKSVQDILKLLLQLRTMSHLRFFFRGLESICACRFFFFKGLHDSWEEVSVKVKHLQYKMIQEFFLCIGEVKGQQAKTTYLNCAEWA